MDLKEYIKQHITITDVASLYVNLKPAGKNLKALCPFHTEKTPSFVVMPERNTFTCFGCNRFGDIFTLVQEMEHLEFREAMQFLAEKFHIAIQLPRGTGPSGEEYPAIMQSALDYFLQNLAHGSDSSTARDYLKKRGLSEDTWTTFSLGYASNSWDGLHTWLRSQKVDIPKAVDLGLLIRSEKNTIYDRFRGRVIFPIFSESGKLIAFGGRSIFQEEPKYLNSPETVLYRKGHHLFGLSLTREFIRKSKKAILVEGYMDLISLFQAGIHPVVASLGTALTDNQVYLLKRFCEEVYIFYDSDTAGIQAAMRSLEKFFEQGINPKIIVNSQFKDPDEWVQKQRNIGLEELTRLGTDGFHFFLDRIAADYDMNRPEKKKAAVDAAMQAVNRIADPIIRDEYVQKTANFFRVDPLLLRHASQIPAFPDNAKKKLLVGPDEQQFLQALVSSPSLLKEVKNMLTEDLLSVLVCRNLLQAMIECYEKDGGVTFEKIAKVIDDGEMEFLNRLYWNQKPDENLYLQNLRRVEDCMLNFIKKINRKKSKQLTRAIANFEKENQLTQVKQLMQEKFKYKPNRGEQN